MPRYPRIWLGCWLADRRERRHGVPSVEDVRAAAAAAGRRPPRRVTATDRMLEVRGGTIPVRVYRPKGAGPLPAHVFAHGGAFFAGSIGELDGLCGEYARDARCAVFSVGYRLAPEHRWPTAAEDMYAVLEWVAAHANDLDVDGDRLSIGGASAGGAVAAAVTLMARDRGGPALRFQLLETPVLDLTMSMPSIEHFASGYLLSRAWLRRGYEHYVPDEAQRRDPYASPLFAGDLSGLPPTFVLTAEFDPLRDEGEAYALRLREAGVPVEMVRARGHIHGSIYSSMRSARRYRRTMAAALREAHYPNG
ncbi:MAG TPA: alpha/beta hydrolase [Jatrophihabitantaceae bacterium]|nr:alpha/beta hydrolase [Jatrophihabitantaceae bacterium]